MTQIEISYRPLTFPEEIEDPSQLRVSKSMLTRKIEAESGALFLKKGVIEPFEDAFIRSGKEDFNTGDFKIKIAVSSSAPRTSWAKIHERLSAYLDVRADDSRAASFDGVEQFPGVGYCLRVEDLQTYIGKLTKAETSTPGKSKSIKWPAKKKTEEYPIEINFEGRSFSRVTRENGVIVLQAKRFISGVAPNLVKPYQAEMQRWFEAETGYNPPDNIPNEELKHDERIVEFARGSYGQVQLVREEKPQYQKAIDQVNEALRDMRERHTVSLIRSTTDEDDVPYVNIKSVSDFLKVENMKENDLVEVGHRYNITP